MKTISAIMLSLAIGISVTLIAALTFQNAVVLYLFFPATGLTMGGCIIHTINKNFSQLREDLKTQSKKDE